MKLIHFQPDGSLSRPRKTEAEKSEIAERLFAKYGSPGAAYAIGEFCSCNQRPRISGGKYCSSCSDALANSSRPIKFSREQAAYLLVVALVGALIAFAVFMTAPPSNVKDQSNQRNRSLGK